MVEADEILRADDRAHRLVNALEERRQALRVLRAPARRFPRWWPVMAGVLIGLGAFSTFRAGPAISSSLGALSAALEQEELQQAADTLDDLDQGLSSLALAGAMVVAGLAGLLAWKIQRRQDAVVAILASEGLLDEEPAEARAARAAHAAHEAAQAGPNAGATAPPGSSAPP